MKYISYEYFPLHLPYFTLCKNCLKTDDMTEMLQGIGPEKYKPGKYANSWTPRVYQVS